MGKQQILLIILSNCERLKRATLEGVARCFINEIISNIYLDICNTK
jgi:hypothetical protein